MTLIEAPDGPENYRAQDRGTVAGRTCLGGWTGRASRHLFVTASETVLRDRQNTRYRAVVDSAMDAIVTTDATGELLPRQI